MTKEKVLLAFSGGLDTSYCVKYLQLEKNLEVYTAIVNTGGFSEIELKEIEDHALSLGAKHHKTIEGTQAFYDHIVKYLIFGNILKNNTYPLSVSAERIYQAIALAEYAKSVDSKYIAHGSTGAGNDQIFGGAAADVIYAGADDDIIVGDAGRLDRVRDPSAPVDEDGNPLVEHGGREAEHGRALSPRWPWRRG